MYRVLIVEDSAFVKSALSNAISQMEGYKIIDTVENAETAEILCLRVPLDLIIMDICTQDGSSGLKSAASIKKNSPNIKIIISTSMPDFSFIKKESVNAVSSLEVRTSSTNSSKNNISSKNRIINIKNDKKNNVCKICFLKRSYI